MPIPLQLVMCNNIIFEISQETNTTGIWKKEEFGKRGIWKKLKVLYMKKSLTNRLILLKTFTYRMKKDSLIKAHLSIFDDLLMKMKLI